MQRDTKENIIKTERKSSNQYKKAQLEERYHLEKSSTDYNYGPQATQPSSTTNQELLKLCNDFLHSQQVTPEKDNQLRVATIQQEDSSPTLWQ